ncbi:MULTISPECIES: hypothetical protein [Nitrosomonas]|uniref:hypothetical protein n=1 Tax=Nitrosomonas TaxID=914 RepID=UPI00079C0B78|nr:MULTISPECIES: hypothetical protein [Nitrosomonas]KXK37408.1 MAG: hypothetical protein UZ02_AOB001002311 [Nitrosomonas europaea]MBV6389635.1 hypothetical protein [Nitrosomonas europaea]QOJ10016.1 MAG: hypothetical protein HRU73_11545 [Nitrosomonas sp. H1_AOB3]
MKLCNYISNLRRYASITIFAFLLMIQYIPMANSGENRAYEKERLLLAERIEKVLTTGGACSSLKDCRERKLLFVSPAKKGLAISTYSVNDNNILRQISEEVIKVFYATDKMSIEVEHFLFTKEDELRSFFKQGKPFVTIKLER